ncbi:alpha-protein kinase 1 [Electrophorus electricus]|uniref:alpha-protein kinase 1 n=1 Tax=Electrophorus electricus TaxID=8005 RepID=UPI0015D04F7B|nr:alpha-protein kinase 1 [Electrophorus electricus]
MNTSELAAVLGECLRLAVKVIPTPDKEAFKYSRGKLSAEVNILLQEAVDMKWPFVVEKWQYKRSVSSEDKVNITDLINQHLPQLMAFLRASILGAQPVWAMSLIFLVDRFLYRIDSSHTLLKIAKALHKRYPETPVAPQVVIRQARVYLNTGKLQKAEYILSSLINNSGATGCWKYHSDSDRILVQAVSVQVRGQVLQKLGLWLESAELIWASLVGFHVLPLPDKKGIGTSLGLLASVLISMNNKEFTTFQKRPHINLGFLGDCSHRLLCAAQAAKLAIVYSQYESLYVLTHMVTQGTCLLSYSFSKECPSADKQGYLALAKEAFENGLLTKSEKEAVTSQQELHTFLKAAYCLAVTNKWLSGPSEAVAMAFHTCRDATVLLYSYCFDDNSDKNALCTQVMAKVQRVKSLLRVKAFTDSQPRPFLPDGCRAMEDKPVPFSLSDFTKVMESFQKHHKSMSEAFKDSSHTGRRDGQGVTHTHCITAFQTLTESLMTECVTTSLKSTEYGPEALGDIENKDILGLKKSPDHLLEVFQKKTLITTLVTEEDQSGCDSGIAEEGKKGGVVKCEGQSSRSSQGSNSLRSSWLDVHDSGESLVLVDPFWCTEADDSVNVDHDEQDHHGPQEEANNYRCKGGVTANASIHQYGLIHSARDSSQAGTMDKGGSIHQEEPCTTLESENNQIIIKTDTGDTGKVSAGSRSKDSRTSSGSHCSSLGSSWQSVSFSKSPQNEDFAKILEDKHSRVDQNCETVATEDGPDSPFEYIDINPSERPISKAGVANPSASSISKGGVATSLQSRNDVGMTQKGCHSQTCIKDQSSIETLEDQEMSLLIHQLSGFELIDTHAGETKANNDSAKSKPNESHLSTSDLANNKPRTSLLSTELDSFEVVQFDQSELRAPTQGFTTAASSNKHKKPLDIQSQSKTTPLLDAQDYEAFPISLNHRVNVDKRDKDQSSAEKPYTLSASMNCCNRCFQGCIMRSVLLSEQDYRSLLSGVCQGCLLKRLPERPFKLSQYNKAYSALVLKYSKATDTWTACETSVYVGELLKVDVEGGQRQAFWVRYLHQELLLGSYVGKEYLRERKIHTHLGDVERQMTAQYYVMEFNKRLYESNVTTQIFYIPSEVLLILEADTITACVSVEPYMVGDFVKLTNNTTKINQRYSSTEFGIAFGHFTYEFSRKEEVVVDLQGWVTANGKGLVYLTDPQIHSLRKSRSPSNFHQNGIRKFLQEQHGERCNPICLVALQRPLQTSSEQKTD